MPATVVTRDPRAPFVRTSLKTDDLALARLKRDALELADDDYWAALILGASGEGLRKRHDAAVQRAEAMGFAYRTGSELLTGSPTDDLLRRLEALSGPGGSPQAEAVLGLVEQPRDTVTEAFEIYLKVITPHELIMKSRVQREDWEKVKRRAVSNFISLNGNVALTEVTREHAHRLYKFWMDRIAPPNGAKPTHTASSGNRDMGNMRQLFERYHKHVGQPDKLNPFAGLSFIERVKRKRPAFTAKWVSKNLLQVGPLHKMNREARGILLMMIECGARPSELCNLHETTIVLDHEFPHIIVEPREDPDDPREIKTASSVRTIPLVGVALEVAKAFPSGFPRYWNNERTLATTLRKMMMENGLLETPKHSPYSIRHMFEDRMKVALFDDELRKTLMGHAIDRPDYGGGFTLETKRNEMLRIVLPFDPAIV